MTSIREVAKLAGVSPATVSRVINGTAKVDDEKKERVLQVISETGFVPNEVARSLFKKSAKTIGLIIPSIENPFFTQLAGVIDRVADANGFRVILCNTADDFEKEKSALQMLAAMNADGIILTTNNMEIQSFVDELSIPVVVTDRLISNQGIHNYVHCDHYGGGRLAMEHLIESGCKNVVCIQGPQNVSSARARYEGYRDVCKEQGIVEQVVNCDYDFHEGLAISEQLLEKYPQVDGILACNDMVAISIYKVLHKRKIAVPEQIQVIGFDDIMLSSLMTPELTTIAQPIEEIGRKAAELIIHREEQGEEREYVFPAKLVVRETTKGKGC
ncbi:MAG: LacI family DNA-binding transcriptional regulator [Lachnospiraceae bacterium]|nr:LacI family DNA-binding transcriptional regulator [Lachnospiraceae bacterium]